MHVLVLKFIQLLVPTMIMMANVATIVNCQHLLRLQILKRVSLKLETALRHAFRHFSGSASFDLHLTFIWPSPGQSTRHVVITMQPWPYNNYLFINKVFQTTIRRGTSSRRWSWWQGIYICLDHVLVNCLLFNQCHNLHYICDTAYQSGLSRTTNFIFVVLLPLYVNRIWDSFCDRPRKNVLR